jgi:hypothetical protein
MLTDIQELIGCVIWDSMPDIIKGIFLWHW